MKLTHEFGQSQIEQVYRFYKMGFIGHRGCLRRTLRLHRLLLSDQMVTY